MKKPMSNFKVETPTVELHAFVKNGRGNMVYAEKGIIKGYANITQAEKRVELLKSLGINCGRTISHPFYIVPVQ